MKRQGIGTVGNIMFWTIYVLVGFAAWWHTYSLFVIKDPVAVAGASALAVDGVLMFTLYILGKTYGDQKKTGMVGIVMFALISAFAQVASRNYGQPGKEWVNYVVDYLLPATITGALLVLGFVKYFDQNSDGVPDFMQGRGRRPTTMALPPHVIREDDDDAITAPPPQRVAVPPQKVSVPPTRAPVRSEGNGKMETTQSPLPKVVKQDEDPFAFEE